jgi:hypothetical protein
MRSGKRGGKLARTVEKNREAEVAMGVPRNEHAKWTFLKSSVSRGIGIRSRLKICSLLFLFSWKLFSAS